VQVHWLTTFDKIFEFEQQLAKYTGAAYAVMTDCCTHAIELCLRFDKIKQCEFTAYTYLSIPMTMHKLGIEYQYIDQSWIGEYQFINTRIWDCARRLESNMYRPNTLMCLSFGNGKPLNIGRGGAVLLDDVEEYDKLRQMRYDGRDLIISPWQNQQVFRIGYHYKPTIEEAEKGLILLEQYKNSSSTPINVAYPDLRKIVIIE
jgi:dTDP-4-amino-4,6-dideoxygalactose transaminase